MIDRDPDPEDARDLTREGAVGRDDIRDLDRVRASTMPTRRNDAVVQNPRSDDDPGLGVIVMVRSHRDGTGIDSAHNKRLYDLFHMSI